MAKDRAKETYDTKKLSVDVDIAGHKMGMDAAKSREQIDTQKGQIAAQLIAAQISANANKKAKDDNIDVQKKGEEQK